MRLVLCAVTLAFSFVGSFFPSHLTGVAIAQEIALPADRESEKPAKPLSIVFILDYSYSMSEKFERGAGQPAIPRLQAARVALETLLNELADAKSGGSEVGVWLFGHRVAWMPQGRLIRNLGAANGPIPIGLAPAEDVENILPLGAFGHAEFGAVSDRLDRAEPFGLSPVNLAILQAVKDFDLRGGNALKRIVVITDGINDQYHAVGGGLKPIRVVTAQDIIAAWQRLKMPISISINYLGDPANPREYATLVKATGGKLLPSKTEAELVDNLRKLNRGE